MALLFCMGLSIEGRVSFKQLITQEFLLGRKNFVAFTCKARPFIHHLYVEMFKWILATFAVQCNNHQMLQSCASVCPSH
jgi:hypothetical protein